MSIAKALKRFLSPGLIDVNIHGIKFPSVEEARWMTNQVFHSPDLGWLEQFEFQLLFASDDMRLGYERYGMIEDGVPLCTAYTQETFGFWVQEIDVKGNLERTPIPLKQEGIPVLRWFPPSLKIKGEVHAVRTYQFRAIDDYKRNTKQFRRQRVNLLVPYTRRVDEHGADRLGIEFPQALRGKGIVIDLPPQVYILRAWMYVGIPEYWNELLDAGFRGFKTVNYYEGRKPWAKEYYDFPKRPLE